MSSQKIKYFKNFNDATHCYNSDEYHRSNKLISATKGWANSLGYKVNVKPNNQIATRAADHHCK